MAPIDKGTAKSRRQTDTNPIGYVSSDVLWKISWGGTKSSDLALTSHALSLSRGTPYGASTIAGSDGSRLPDERELDIACHQGEYVAKLTAKLNS